MMSAQKYLMDEAAQEPRKDIGEACRSAVRKIQSYPVLSPEWMQLVEQLKKLTRLVHLETKMPANEKVVELQGRDSQSAGTLWDQSAVETAIRTLVEEAKVNLCLRIMHDFKKWQSNPDETATALATAKLSVEVGDPQVQTKVAQFEEALAMLLGKALAHVETLQLMDTHLLIEHIVFVIEHASANGNAPLNVRMSEAMVLHYFSHLMRHAEKLNNGELLAQSRDTNLVRLVLDHVLTHRTELDNELKDIVAVGFAKLADNEDFRPQWEEYFRTVDGSEVDVELKRRFLELKEVVVPSDDALRENPEKKKELRPLLDFLARLKMKL